MVERKLYKTQICLLYKKGKCHRQTCSFAHGDSELRRFSASFNGRRDYQGSDLRDRLGRRGTPPRRFSLDREARDRQTSHGYSPRSVAKRSDRKHRKKQPSDGENERSGSMKASDGTEDQVTDRKLITSSSKDVLDEQLRQLQSEFDMLNGHKHQLERLRLHAHFYDFLSPTLIPVSVNLVQDKYSPTLCDFLKIYLEERVQESDSLTSKIQDLEIQLFKEKEECKRISSKIRKFIKEHNRHSKIQDELKRSQDRLQKLADQLGTEAVRSTNEDASINIVSDEETFLAQAMSPQTELLRTASPSRKRVRSHMVEAREESKQGLNSGAIKREFSKWDTHLDQGNKIKEFRVGANGNNGFCQLVSEDKSRKGKSIVTDIVSAVKMKDSEPDHVLPTTGMADHSVDEVVEVVELDEKYEDGNNTSATVHKGVAHDIPGVLFPLPPPPPLPRNVYPEYIGKDENVDVDGLDDEMVDVDIV